MGLIFTQCLSQEKRWQRDDVSICKSVCLFFYFSSIMCQQTLDRRAPFNSLLFECCFDRAKTAWLIEWRHRDINGIRALRVGVGQRCPAFTTESAGNARRRSVHHWIAWCEFEFLFGNHDPGDGLSSDESAAVLTMADSNSVGICGNYKTNRAAAAATRFIGFRSHLCAPAV